MHKVSAAVAVAVLAVKVCMAHMVVLVPEGSFGTEDQDHFEKGRNLVVGQDKLVGLGTAVAEVRSLAAAVALDKILVAAHIVHSRQGSIADSALQEDLDCHDCIGLHNNLLGLSIVAVDLAEVVCKVEFAFEPSCDSPD